MQFAICAPNQHPSYAAITTCITQRTAEDRGTEYTENRFSMNLRVLFVVLDTRSVRSCPNVASQQAYRKS